MFIFKCDIFFFLFYPFSIATQVIVGLSFSFCNMPFGTRKYGNAAVKRSRRLQLERSRESKSEKGDSAPAAPGAAAIA